MTIRHYTPGWKQTLSRIMPPMLRNVLAVIAGLLVGSAINMWIITMVLMFGGPVWFAVLDLSGAYLPMGYLGGMLGGAKKPQPE